MSPSERFTKATEEVRELNSQPSDTDMLELYSLYKQATVGDCCTTRPGLPNFKGKAKWDAWDSKKGISQEEAERQYIQKVDELIAKIGKK